MDLTTIISPESETDRPITLLEIDQERGLVSPLLRNLLRIQNSVQEFLTESPNA